MFRVMRVLRLVSSTYGLRVGLQAIMSAIPSVISVVLIMILFFIIFGVIGVSYFKGKYYYCWQDRVKDMNGYNEVFLLKTKWDCYNTGADWRREYYNFDNIYEAMSTLFIMANLSSWADVMYKGTKVTEIDYERLDGNHPYWVFFFIAFIIIGSFFLLNLFVGVVHSSFKRQTDSLGGYNLMTDN